MTEKTRPVWLTHGDVSWLHTSADTPQRSEALTRLNIGFNRAPADAKEAVKQAIRDFYAHSVEGVEFEHDAVLRALGWRR